MHSIEKGQHRLNRFQRDHIARFGRPFSGRLLDFGCGAGAFVIAARLKGIDVHGIEVDEERRRQFMANAQRHEPSAADRMLLYPGRLMPYPSSHFDGCYSWFVFEHVADPQTCLREIVRVLKPGGTLTIQAEDARNCWDGHAQVPWPPFMPREFAAAYLEGLGRPGHAEFVTKSVVYITAPIMVDILKTLGMEVLYSNPAPPADSLLLKGGLHVTNEDEARRLGRKVAERGWTDSPAENLTIFAAKPPITHLSTGGNSL